MEFGFLTDNKRVVVNNIEVKPMWDLEKKIERLHQKGAVSNGWLYPPLVDLAHDFSEKDVFKTKTQIQASFFQIEPTHAITIFPYDGEKLKFLILAYGFLKGIYLIPAGYLCIHRIPYKIGMLTGVILTKGDAEKGLSAFSLFYDKLNFEKRNLLFSILHWFLIGQAYNYAWDIFDAQYKVLDAIYKFSGLSVSYHSQRPLILAKHYGIKIPKWAETDSSRNSILSKVRNELVHEAKYGGKPIGYGYPDVNFGLEFARFNSKLIIATIGLKSSFLESEPGDRNTHAWDFS